MIDTRRPRVALVNLGCRVNRVELDAIAAQLETAGCVVVPEAQAELVVVNTCAVTGEAEAKARKAVRHAAALPLRPVVVATGCVASLFADELASLGERVVVEPVKSRVAERALAELERSAAPSALGAGDCSKPSSRKVGEAHGGLGPTADAPGGSAAGEHLVNLAAHGGEQPVHDGAPAPEQAVTPTGRMRPGLKVQDGCDNRCAYCIVWKARGPARSLEAARVVAGVRSLMEDGAQEIVLTGIDLGRYDSDGLDLAGLLRLVLAETAVGRVRLSSVEPAGVTPELLEVMAGSGGRVAPFLHVPLQSGCDATLARMGRPYSMDEYRAVVSRARAAVPGLALACDLIVGFPGETDLEFAESLASCAELSFAKMHVFRYSRRPGTPAATMEGQVPPEISAERSRVMRELAAETRRAYVSSLVGTEQLVLVERAAMGVSGGLVDTLVDEGLRGKLVRVVPHGVASGSILDARGAAAVVS